MVVTRVPLGAVTAAVTAAVTTIGSVTTVRGVTTILRVTTACHLRQESRVEDGGGGGGGYVTRTYVTAECNHQRLARARA